MKPKFPAIAAAMLASAALAHGATFVDNFATLVQNPTISDPGQNLSTYNGWSSETVGPDPLAFGYTTNGSNGFALGPFFTEPAGSSTSAEHAVTGGLAGTTLLTTFTIIDSNAEFPDRNDYSIRLLTAGTPVFSFDLNAVTPAAPPGSGQWNASVGGGSTFVIVPQDGTFDLMVTFVQNAVNVDYNVSLTPAGGGTSFTTSGTVLGGASFAVDAYRVTTSLGSASAWGDGAIGINNVNLVPETSSVSLLGMAALGLLRRRRQS